MILLVILTFFLSEKQKPIKALSLIRIFLRFQRWHHQKTLSCISIFSDEKLLSHEALAGRRTTAKKQKTSSRKMSLNFFPLQIQAKDFLSKMDFPSSSFRIENVGWSFVWAENLKFKSLPLFFAYFLSFFLFGIAIVSVVFVVLEKKPLN